MMYAPMKNLSRQLPNANLPSFSTCIDDKIIQTPLLADQMPRPHPLRSISSPTGYRNGDNEQRGGWKDLQIVENDPITGQRSERLFTRDDDQESIIRLELIAIFIDIVTFLLNLFCIYYYV